MGVAGVCAATLPLCLKGGPAGGVGETGRGRGTSQASCPTVGCPAPCPTQLPTSLDAPCRQQKPDRWHCRWVRRGPQVPVLLPLPVTE